MWTSECVCVFESGGVWVCDSGEERVQRNRCAVLVVAHHLHVPPAHDTIIEFQHIFNGRTQLWAAGSFSSFRENQQASACFYYDTRSPPPSRSHSLSRFILAAYWFRRSRRESSTTRRAYDKRDRRSERERERNSSRTERVCKRERWQWRRSSNC